MDCEKTRLLISARLDGETSKEETAALADHLSSCADCRAEEARLAEVGRAFHGVTRTDTAVDLWPRLAPGPGSERWPILPAGLVLLLPAWRLLDLSVGLEPLAALKLVPVLLAAVVFILLRKNPFRIEPRLEGATS